jgi:hypothetical protein
LATLKHSVTSYKLADKQRQQFNFRILKLIFRYSVLFRWNLIYTTTMIRLQAHCMSYGDCWPIALHPRQMIVNYEITIIFTTTYISILLKLLKYSSLYLRFAIAVSFDLSVARIPVEYIASLCITIHNYISELLYLWLRLTMHIFPRYLFVPTQYFCNVRNKTRA